MTRASKVTQIYSDGIFHGLPIFPESLSGLRAMIVGASGQSGQPLVDVLSSNPNRWEKVYALSRRPPARSSSNVEHVPVDLLWETERISSVLVEHKVQVSVNSLRPHA